MKLMTAGIISPWLLLLAFVCMSAITIYIYRKQNLPKPWGRILPALRIIVFALLMISLLQPVLARFTSKIVRGNIPVLVDTSGSMSLTDNYSPSRKVEIAWQLKLFAAKHRNTVFLNERDELDKLAVADIDIKDAKLAVKQLKKVSKGIKDIDKKLKSEIKKTGYLKDFKADNSIESLGNNLEAMSRSLNEATKKKDKKWINNISRDFKKRQAEINKLYGLLTKMQETADVALAGSGNKAVDQGIEKMGAMTRMQLVHHVLTDKENSILQELGKKGDVEVFSFKDKTSVLQKKEYDELKAEHPSTKTGSVIQKVLKRYEQSPVSAVILLSDGNSNAGTPLQSVRQGMQERNIPLFSMGVGSPLPPDDIALARVIAPHTAFIKDSINVNVLLKRSGFTDKSVKLRITCDGKVVKKETIKPGKETTIMVSMPFVEKSGGTKHYVVEAELHETEAIKHNNKQAFTVTILEDRIRTLLIDEFPRWESRYANMMLKRDHRVDLNTIFIGSTEKGVLPVEKGKYPATRKELLGYHIVILGDVNPAHFSEEQKEDLRAFVIERGGCLIAIAGNNYMPDRYEGTVLEDLIPLKKFTSRKSTAAYATADEVLQINTLDDGIYKLKVEEFAQYDDILQIGGTPENSQLLWNKLPGMNWVKEGVAVSRSADPLVGGIVNKGKGSSSPVMIRAYAGDGRILYLGSDSFWRWRYRSRWTYHHRFWGQILLWATLSRTTGSDEHVKLMTDRFTYAPEEKIIVRARILDDDGIPIENADASIEIYKADDKIKKGNIIKSTPLVHIEGSGGEYRAQLHDLENGSYKIIPRVEELKDKDIEALAEFQVTDLSTSEFVELALNEALLKEISDKYLPLEKIRDIVKDIPVVEKKQEQREDEELWDTLPFIILICCLLGFEWIMRKRLKLV